MKHLAAIQTEFIKEARKWKDLSLEDQRAYLKRHPKSKRRLIGKSKTPKQTRTEDQSDVLKAFRDIYPSQKKFKEDTKTYNETGMLNLRDIFHENKNKWYTRLNRAGFERQGTVYLDWAYNLGDIHITESDNAYMIFQWSNATLRWPGPALMVNKDKKSEIPKLIATKFDRAATDKKSLMSRINKVLKAKREK